MSLTSYEMRFWGIGAAAIALVGLGCNSEPAPYPPPTQCVGANCSPGNAGGVNTTHPTTGAGGTGGTLSNTCTSPMQECSSDNGAGGAATTICTDVQTDPNNCGTCNDVCAAGDICMGGMCVP